MFQELLLSFSRDTSREGGTKGQGKTHIEGEIYSSFLSFFFPLPHPPKKKNMRERERERKREFLFLYFPFYISEARMWDSIKE